MPDLMPDFMSTSAYFDQLRNLLAAAEVTDASGAAISLDAGMARLCDALLALRRRGGLAVLVGNGGSAAIADHLHCDLSLSCGLKAVVLTNTPSLTAAANDFGYQQAYARQLACWGDLAERGGLLLAISSSGASENILRTVAAARELGMQVATCTGFAPDNPLRRLGDVNFYVPAAAYGPVELAHACLAHYLADRLKATGTAGAAGTGGTGGTGGTAGERC
ncbi:SIS domain-containing protein [Megalodesulfovibrio paquesii]